MGNVLTGVRTEITVGEGPEPEVRFGASGGPTWRRSPAGDRQSGRVRRTKPRKRKISRVRVMGRFYIGGREESRFPRGVVAEPYAPEGPSPRGDCYRLGVAPGQCTSKSGP
jgi:hypothetical protein